MAILVYRRVSKILHDVTCHCLINEGCLIKQLPVACKDVLQELDSSATTLNAADGTEAAKEVQSGGKKPRWK